MADYQLPKPFVWLPSARATSKTIEDPDDQFGRVIESGGSSGKLVGPRGPASPTGPKGPSGPKKSRRR